MTDDRTIELRGDDRRTYTYRVLSLFELAANTPS